MEKDIQKLKQIILDSLRECQSIEALAERLAKCGVRAVSWRSAEDEPPIEEGQYIVMIKGARLPTSLYYYPSAQIWQDAFGADYSVERWQPMPLPPDGCGDEPAVCGRCVHFSGYGCGEGKCDDNSPDSLAYSNPACLGFEPVEGE